MSGARIAVVGMACRYPDADSPDRLWENVLTGRRNVDPEIRSRVTAIVAALGYHPDRVASSLRSAARTACAPSSTAST